MSYLAAEQKEKRLLSITFHHGSSELFYELAAVGMMLKVLAGRGVCGHR
jgi:hypothetical protein